MSRLWHALQIEAPAVDVPVGVDDLLPVVLDDWAPLAIEDLAERPLPPGGLWDPTFPPIPRRRHGRRAHRYQQRRGREMQHRTHELTQGF